MILSLIFGYDRDILLSQYIGDFHPEAQTYGFFKLIFIELIEIREDIIFCALIYRLINKNNSIYKNFFG